MKNSDSLQRFIFEDTNVRGEIVHLNDSFETIMQQHHYPAPIRQLLGECLVASVLLTATIKFEGQLTIQFQSDSDIKLLLAKCNHEMQIRGLAQFDHDAVLKLGNKPNLGYGSLVITIENTNKAKNYQSMVPIENRSIAQCLEYYFGQSEQLSTRLWLAVGENHASGMLLQLMPEHTSKEKEDFWEHATKMSDTIKDQELLDLPNQELLHRLYHDIDVRIFEPSDVEFKCTCDYERMQNAIRMLGKIEADAILSEKQSIGVTCEFCNNEYVFSKDEVEKIFEQKHS